MTDQKTVVDPNEIDEKKSISEGGNESETSVNSPVIDEDIVPTEIPVRRNQEYIIARQKRTIDKLRSKMDTDVEKDDADDGEPDVNRQIDQKINPLISQLARNADEGELKDLIRDTPEAKQYEKRIRGYMEKWENTPVEAIYHFLARQDEMKAKGKKSADDIAAHERSAGTGHRTSKTSAGEMPSAEEIDGMDDKEFESLQEDVRTGKYIKK